MKKLLTLAIVLSSLLISCGSNGDENKQFVLAIFAISDTSTETWVVEFDGTEGSYTREIPSIPIEERSKYHVAYPQIEIIVTNKDFEGIGNPKGVFFQGLTEQGSRIDNYICEGCQSEIGLLYQFLQGSDQEINHEEYETLSDDYFFWVDYQNGAPGEKRKYFDIELFLSISQ